MELSELKLDIQKPRIVKGIYDSIIFGKKNILSLYALDKALFPKGFFSNTVKNYILYEFTVGCDLDDEIFQWIDDGKHEHWFDIKKDINCKYYFLAGDEFGVKYYGRIHAITFMINDIKIGLEEDLYNYYINTKNLHGELSIFTKISKYDFELKSAIVRAMRKINPHIFPGFTLEWKI